MRYDQPMGFVIVYVLQLTMKLPAVVKESSPLDQKLIQMDHQVRRVYHV